MQAVDLGVLNYPWATGARKQGTSVRALYASTSCNDFTLKRGVASPSAVRRRLFLRASCMGRVGDWGYSPHDGGSRRGSYLTVLSLIECEVGVVSAILRTSPVSNASSVANVTAPALAPKYRQHERMRRVGSSSSYGGSMLSSTSDRCWTRMPRSPPWRDMSKYLVASRAALALASVPLLPASSSLRTTSGTTTIRSPDDAI